MTNEGLQAEIVTAVDFNTGREGTYEVSSKFLTWPERKADVKAKRKTLVYHISDLGKPLINSWFSVGKIKWEQCKRVIRKIS